MLCSKKSWLLGRSVLSTIMTGVVVVSVGCAERPAVVSSIDLQVEQDQSPATIATGVADQSATTAPLSQAVVGTWLGQAMLDEPTLERKLEQLTPDEQERVFIIAENFLSTVMAMDVRNDGTIESEVEMQPLGEAPIRDSTVGQWRATQTGADQLAIELEELAEDDSTVLTKRSFQFYPDRNAFVMPVPIPEELKGCQAIMVFERQSATANVAQRSENTKR